MILVQKIADIDYNQAPAITMKASVVDVTSEGDGDKKPIKVILKLETNGETLQICSWRHEYLDVFKAALKTGNVLDIQGSAQIYRGDKEVRVNIVKDTGVVSVFGSKVTNDIAATEGYRAEIQKMIDTYLTTTPLLKQITEMLLMQSEQFWVWPAASKMHHAFPGGLAKHTCNVCRNAVDIASHYTTTNINMPVLVAGALLHDVGKMVEYNQDGSRCEYGNLIPHPVIGCDEIMKIALQLGVDPEKEPELIILRHIILSHHEKLEWGASTSPHTIEALIVARSDYMDATCEALDNSLDKLAVNTSSERIAAFGNSILKWF